MDDRELIYNFIKNHSLAVISTHNGGYPEAALVAFAETADLELIFQTHVDSRKYKNLQSNSRVAFVIGWNEKIHITVQYEGNAIELYGDEATKYRDTFLSKKTPCVQEFIFHPKSRIFKVNPKWIGYSNYTNERPSILELTF